MNTTVVVAAIWFRGGIYRIREAALKDGRAIVEIDPQNNDLQHRIETHLLSYMIFHNIPLTYSGPYKYFPEDAAEFETWRYQQNHPAEGSGQ